MALQRTAVRALTASLAAGVVALVLAGGGTTATSSSTILTVAGDGAAANTGDGGQAREASIDEPRSLFTVDGGYVWAQPWSNRVRIVDSAGIVRTLAGTGVAGFSGDGGQATQAKLNFVHSAAPTADGGFLVADTLNSRIRKIAASGIITTVAGTGSAGYTGDGGPATSARINNPRGVAALPDGGFLFPDTNNHRVRRVAPNGTITTVAGTGVQGFSGDGGAATAAQLSLPFAVAPTPDGGFLVIDVGNQRIRKVSAAGTITTVAGTGVKGFSGDGGPATSAQLADPHNLAVFADGSFVIADASNERVRLVDASGTITTLAGTGVRGFSGDGGPAGAAQVAVPKAVAVTPAGDVLIGDEQNNRIRFVGTVVAPQNVAPPTVGGAPVQGQTMTAHAGGWTGTGPVPSYQWERCSPGCSPIAGATGKVYVPSAGDVGSSLRVTVTASNPAGSGIASSAQTETISAPIEPPVNTSPPVVSGTAAEGETLSVDPGSWSGTPPVTFSYEWLRCNTSGGSCTAVPGATAADYTLAGADVGSTVRARVTASNGGSVYGTAVTADAPSAYWRFGGTGPLVDSVGTATGSFSGGAERGVPGLLVGDTDTAVTFDGAAAYADVPASSAWTPSAFSIEVLVRPSATPDNRTIWSTQGTFTGWWLNTGPSGNVRMFVGDGSAWRRGPDGPVLQPGQTYHVVATYDGVNARLYVDGALVSTSPTIAMAPNGGANVMRFAAFSTGPGQYWPGTIDEASFYPAVLSPAEIAAHLDASLSGSVAESAATAVVSGAPPVNTALPVVSGSPQVGQSLSVSTGSWSGSQPISFAYRWQRCAPGCSDVGGATSSAYTVVSSDVGATLRAVVTASNGAGSAEAASAQTAVVSDVPSSGSMTFSIVVGGDDGDVAVTRPQGSGYPPSGTPEANAAGSVLTAGRRAAFGNFQVLAGLLRFDTSSLPDGATVTGARLRVYVKKKTDADDRSLMAEWYAGSSWPIDPSDWVLSSSGSALGGSDITGISTGAVNSFALTGVSAVSTTGTTGLRLHVSGGQPSGDNYVQMAAFENSSLPAPELVVDYSDGPPPPPSAPVNTAAPVVAGQAVVGQALTVSNGSWSGSQPMSFAYRWQRCTPTCVDIGGATSSSYTAASADVGATLRAVVTASNSVGSTDAASAETAVVTDEPPSSMTFSVTAGGDDGDVAVTASQGSGYPPSATPEANSAGTVLTAGRRAAFGNFQVLAGLLRFDTSALPDGATVTSATLNVFVTAKKDADARNLVAEWYPASSWPIDPSDWVLSSSGSALAGSDITGISTGAVNSFPLTGVSAVSTTGPTALRLHVSGGQPSGDNYVQMAALENSKPQAQLVVEFSDGLPPPSTPPANTAVPVVSGQAVVGQALTVSNGSWSGSQPMSFAYRWQRCAPGCGDIVGATSSTYTAVAGDVGATLRALVTASNTAGSAEAASAQTSAVAAEQSSGSMTFPIVSGGDDGDVAVTGPQASGYPPAGTAEANSVGSVLTAGRRAAFGNFQVLVGLLRFDTSALPDGATVTGARLRVYVKKKTDADGRSLVAEWYDASSWSIEPSDWVLSSSGSALAGSDITAISTGAVNGFVLTGVSAVSTTGSTALRLHVSGGQPSGDNYVQIASFEDPSLPAPELVVDYVIP